MAAAASAGWLSALVAVAAPLAVLAGIAYAELRGRWPRRALASLALVGAAATVVGLVGILT